MSGIWLFGVGLELAGGLTEFALQWLVQSTVIITLGMAVAAIVRRRNPAVLSAVYQTTLIAVLAAPVVSRLMAAAGLTFITLQLPPARYEVEELVAVTRPVDPEPLPPADELALDEVAPGTFDDPREPDQQVPPVAEPLAPLEFAGEVSASSPAIAPLDTDSEAPSAAPPLDIAESAPATVMRLVTQTNRWLAAVLVGVPAIWLVGTLVLLSRLAIDHWRLARLRRSALAVDEDTAQVAVEIAARMHLSLPRLMSSPFVGSPCLCGLWWPVILLPDELDDAGLPAVLVHELAHYKRNDCLWNLLRHAATALLWPQPLAWRLSRRMEAVAEDVCDDYVVELGTSRQTYAETLLAIAERNLLPVSEAAVSLVTFRSMLGQRVDRILDQSRRLSLTVGLAALVIIATGGVTAALLAGLLGPGSTRLAQAKDPVTEVAPDEPTETAVASDYNVERKGDDAAADANQGEVAAVTLRGRVLDPAGSPAAGARLQAFVIRPERMSRDSSQAWQEVTPNGLAVGDDGSFAIELGSPAGFTGWPDEWPRALVIATHEGAGAAWQQVNAKKLDEPVMLKLIEDAPITAQLVNLEGQPIAGATVAVQTIETNADSDLSAWLAALRSGATYQEAEKQRGAHVQLGFQSRWGLDLDDRRFVDIRGTTDEQGWVTLRGIGRGRLANLLISGPGIVTTRTKAVAQPMEPVDIDMSGFSLPAQQRIHGADFKLAIENSAPIAGVVRDAETGEPLPGVRVVSNRMAGSTWVQNYLVSTTSAPDGSYLLDGMPSGKGNQVLAIPAADQPYFLRNSDVPQSQPLDEVELDLELVRGVWIEGQVRDVETKQPILGQLHYLPWPNHPRLADLPGYMDRALPGPPDHYVTDAEGRFRLVGLPGRGVILFERREFGRSTRSYPNGQGLSEIADLPTVNEFQPISQLYTPYSPFVAAVKEVNAAEAGPTSTTIELREGARVRLRLLDPEGQPVAGTHVEGLHPHGQFHGQAILGAVVEVGGLAPQESRTVVIEHRERKLGTVLEVIAAMGEDDPVDVSLEPYATIRGRIIKAGDPLRGSSVQFTYKLASNFGGQDTTSTDSDGYFHEDVPPGLELNISVHSYAPKFQVKSLAQNITADPGETIDFGEIDIASEERPTPKRTPAESRPDAESNSTRTKSPGAFHFAGKVVGPDGKPVGGAKLYVIYYTPNAIETKPLAVSAADGSFSFEMAKDEFDTGEMMAPWEYAKIVAVADGFGPGWVRAAGADASGEILQALEATSNYRPNPDIVATDSTIRLVADDVPIEGQLVDLEGQPIAGARVQVIELHGNPQNSLDGWIDAVENQAADYYQARQELQGGFLGLHMRQQIAQLFTPVATDAAGRFRVTGVGRERIVMLQVEGNGIETRQLYVRTRPGPTYEIPHQRRFPDSDTETYYGAQFSAVFGPSRDVVGVVRDRDTGEPLAGVLVASDKIAGQRTSGLFSSYIRTTTDEDGRYRLRGLPIGENRIGASPPNDEPHLPGALNVTTSLDGAESTVDFPLTRGIWYRGRVTDADTGKPLRAQVDYFAFRDNPHAAAAKPWGHFDHRRITTDSDGRFAVRGLPGQGIVGVRTNDFNEYPYGVGTELITCERASGIIIKNADARSAAFSTRPGACVSMNYHALKEVNPAEDATEHELDFSLQAGPTLAGTILDPQGEPLAGCEFAHGIWANSWTPPLRTAQFTVSNLQPDRPRRLTFLHRERKLAGAVPLEGTETEPLRVTLAPYAVVTGRVLMPSGEPAEDAELQGRIPQGEQTFGVLPDPNRLHTDAAGRFRIEGLAPNTPYSLVALKGRQMLGQVIERFELEPGETKDLGDLTIEPQNLAAMVSAATSTTASKPAADDPPSLQFTGKVLDPAGQPAAGAEVILIYGPDYRRGNIAHVRATTAADGTFTVQAPRDKILSKPRGWAQIFVRGEESFTWENAAAFETSGQMLAGLSWRDRFFHFLDTAKHRTLRLVNDLPITGRILNLEGQGVAGAKLRVQEVRANHKSGLDPWLATVERGPTWRELPDSIGRVTLDQAGLADLLPSVTTGDDGQFVLRGVGRDRLVELLIEGPGLESRQVRVATRAGEVIQIPRDVTDPQRGHDLCYPATFDYAAAPSVPVTGLVTDVDTGEPMPGVTVVPEQIPGSDFHSTVRYQHLATTTDEAGRYTIRGLPIGESFLTARAPDDQPYATAALYVETKPSDDRATLDFQLKRGIWVRGRAVDAESGEPVVANVVYLPLSSNEHLSDAPGAMRDMRPHSPTDAEGRYQVVALPGRGLISLLAHDNQNERKYPRGVGAEKIDGNGEGRQKTFPTVPYLLMAVNTSYVAEIDPEPGTEAIEHDIKLHAGRTITATLFDPDDNPVGGAMVSGTVNTSYWQVIDSATLTVHHLEPGKPRAINVYHPQRELAGRLVIQGDESGPLDVKLQPAGTIRGTIRLANGDPAARVRLSGPFRSEVAESPPAILPSREPILTDDQGRFTVGCLVPGLRYSIGVVRGTRYLGLVTEDVTVEPGETKDLGDLTVRESN